MAKTTTTINTIIIDSAKLTRGSYITVGNPTSSWGQRKEHGGTCLLIEGERRKGVENERSKCDEVVD